MATEVPKKDEVCPNTKEHGAGLGVSVCACASTHTPTENCYGPHVLN